MASSTPTTAWRDDAIRLRLITPRNAAAMSAALADAPTITPERLERVVGLLRIDRQPVDSAVPPYKAHGSPAHENGRHP